MGVPEWDDLNEAQRKQFFESPLFKKYYAYRSFTDGVRAMQAADGHLYDALADGVLRRMSSVTSRDTVDEFFEALVAEVEEHTDVVAPTDAADEEVPRDG